MSKYLELVEGSFTQEHLDKQKNQNPYVAYSIKDGNVIYTIVPKEDEETWLISAVLLKDISNLTYNEVDLGEAGIWADRNVGAASPEDYGSYFQWGSTDSYTYEKCVEVTTDQLLNMLLQGIGEEVGVTKDNIKEVFASMGIVDNNLIGKGLYTSLLDEKYNLQNYNFNTYFDTKEVGSPILSTTFNKYYNDANGLKILEPCDDAATIHMSNEWQIPSPEDFQKLIDNTTLYIVDLNDNEYEHQVNASYNFECKGIKFKASNGNSIFLPFSGVLYDLHELGQAEKSFTILDCDSTRGLQSNHMIYLWTNELYPSNLDTNECLAKCLGCDMVDTVSLVGRSNLRSMGFPIRAIKKS